MVLLVHLTQATGASVPPLKRERWLDRCEGFGVDGPEGHVGTVECVRCSLGNPLALIVRTGLFRVQYLDVGVDGIEEIHPERRRIVLGSDPRLNRG